MVFDMGMASVGSELGSYVITMLASTLGRGLVDADSYFSSNLYSILTSVGDPQLRASWFAGPIFRMLPAVEIVALTALLIAAILAVLQGDATAIMRSIVLYLPLTALFAGGELQFTGLLLGAAQGLSGWIYFAFATSGQAGDNLHGAAASLLAPGVPTLIGVAVAVAYLVFALLLWLELALRVAAIYMVVAILPFGFALALLRSGRKMLFRLLEVLLGLIFVKVVIALGLGISSAIASFAHLTNFTLVVVATASLVLCVLSPFAVLRLLVAIDVAQLAEFERAPQAAIRLGRRAASFADQSFAASEIAANEIVDFGRVPFATGRADLADEWRSMWLDKRGGAGND